MDDSPLSSKFSAAEQAAYRWLHDCKIVGWLVDLKTKQVHTAARKWDSLVAFAKSKGRKSDGR